MQTRPDDARSTAVAAGVALGLAGCAALSLAVGDAIGFVTDRTEAVFALLFMVGWMLLAWATIVGGVVSVHLIRVSFRRSPALIEIALVVATAAVIAGVILTHPLAGSGSGAA